MTIVQVTNHPQLFLDDVLIARMDNLQRVVQQPRKHPQNPVLRREHPWEKRVVELYGTVLYDDAARSFRCWYLGNEKKDGKPVDTPEGPKLAEYYQCFAESDDGVHWSKPLVGIGRFAGHERHNIVIYGGHGFCVVPTPDDPDPDKKFKGAGGASYGFSPDGLRWTLHNWRDAVGKNDTGTSVVRWNGQYLAYVRYQISDPIWPGVMRGVGLSCSTEFQNWSPKQLVFRTDEQDGYPWTQPYGLSVTPYGDQLIGMLWMLHLDRIENNNRHGDMDVQLIVSRDGRTWHRVADRQVFLAPTADTWDRGRVFPGTSMLVKDDLVHIYYTGTDTRHGEQWGNPGIGLATLPADRFVAIRPARDGVAGVLETPLLDLRGARLVLNADVAPQDLQVELLDAAGGVLPGFDRAKSRLAARDRLRYVVSWDCAGEDRQYGGRPARQPAAIRFILRNGALYSFQLER